MDSRGLVTALNCSIGRDSWVAGLDAAVTAGIGRVELWWPFAVPDPSADEIDGLVAALADRRLTLVALNLFGGDLAAGDRGVLHASELPATHLDAVTRIHERTGVDRFNVLLGRGGEELLPAQADRFGAVARTLGERFGGVAMVEPLSGVAEYPVLTVVDGLAALEAAGAGGLLLDLFHIAANAQARAEAEGRSGETPTAAGVGLGEAIAAIETVAHVQIADLPGRGAPGTGALQLAEWIGALRDAGYPGDVVGEWLES